MRSKILTSGLIVFTLGILFFAALMAASALPPQDLTQYWSAAHLVRQNPYSPQLVAELERTHGILIRAEPLVLKNPPWAIPFILPLGLFSYHVGFALWAVFSVVVVVGCAGAIWRLVEIPQSIISILLPLLFGPTIVLLELGQWTVLVLLGITGFLIGVERRKDWIAGAFLLLVMGKPHVALLFLLAIALWTVQTRRWAVMYSAALSLAAACISMLAVNGHVFGQFLERTRQVVDERVAYPNLGGMLYIATGIHALAILPQVMGVLWLLFYWSRHRNSWDWKSDGMLVLVSSIACSYYSYPYDEILVLPALVMAFLTGNRRTFLLLFAATELGYGVYLLQIAGKFGFSYMFLSWTAAAWLVTYLASQPSAQRHGMLAETS
ncbi:MAG TPA: glycosyltransferase family 87 protein [Terracidiphilus sp.]|jgi:hypothetical protein